VIEPIASARSGGLPWRRPRSNPYAGLTRIRFEGFPRRRSRRTCQRFLSPLPGISLEHRQSWSSLPRWSTPASSVEPARATFARASSPRRTKTGRAERADSSDQPRMRKGQLPDRRAPRPTAIGGHRSRHRGGLRPTETGTVVSIIGSGRKFGAGEVSKWSRYRITK
jgi:hypothetical protein